MGANSRLQYQNQFIATDADQITTQTANTDEILLAETTWDEVINGITNEGTVDNPNFTPKATILEIDRTAELGDVYHYFGDGTDDLDGWLKAGSLTDLEDITTIASVNAVADAGAFNSLTHAENQVVVVTAAIASGITKLNDASSPSGIGTAAKGDIFIGTGTTDSYTDAGNLSDIVDGTIDGITAVGDLVAKANTLENDVAIINVASITISSTKVPTSHEHRFHPVQPLIIESSLRGGGENIPLPYKTGNSAMTKDAPGPISVEEGMVFAGTGDGMEMFYRMMTQTRKPKAEYLNDNTDVQPIVTTGNLGTGTALVADRENIANLDLTPLSDLNDGVTTGSLPVRLDVKPNKDASGTGLIKIEGQDKDGLKIEEFLAWTSGQASQKTKNYYSAVDTVRSSGWPATTTATITCTDTSRKITYEPQDEELVAFWFVRLVTGITPRLFSGVIGNSFEVALARDTALEWTVSCLGKRSWPNRNIRGEEWNANSGTITLDNRRGRKVGLDSSIGFADPSIFTGWQCELDIGGTRMALIDSTLSINQNLENSGVITGDRYEEAQPFRGTDREVMVDGTVVYSPENNLSQVYLDNATLEDVQLNLRNRPRGGFYWLTRFVFPTTQINTNPDPASPRDGRISQTFNLKCFHEGVGGNPRDYYIETIVPDYEPVRDFSV